MSLDLDWLGKEIPEREREGVDDFLFKDLTNFTDEEMRMVLCCMHVDVLARAICREDAGVKEVFLRVLVREDAEKVLKLIETRVFDVKQIRWARANMMRRALELFCLGKISWRTEKGAA